MTKFKVGDLVKRIADPIFDYRYMKSGEVYQITGLPEDDSESLQVNDTDDYWMKRMFELYAPLIVVQQSEPTELEEALAHIESLESALEDAVRELILLRSGNHALLGAALTLTSLHTGNNTAVIDVNQGQFKPISEYTLEDWELAIDNNWEFELRSGKVVPVDEFHPNEGVYVVSLNTSTQTIAGKVFDWNEEHENDIVKRVK